MRGAAWGRGDGDGADPGGGAAEFVVRGLCRGRPLRPAGAAGMSLPRPPVSRVAPGASDGGGESALKQICSLVYRVYTERVRK